MKWGAYYLRRQEFSFRSGLISFRVLQTEERERERASIGWASFTSSLCLALFAGSVTRPNASNFVTHTPRNWRACNCSDGSRTGVQVVRVGNPG
jgi:hypothetical protein